MESYISKSVIENKIELFKEEKDYVEKHKLLAEDIIIVEKKMHRVLRMLIWSAVIKRAKN